MKAFWIRSDGWDSGVTLAQTRAKAMWRAVSQLREACGGSVAEALALIRVTRAPEYDICARIDSPLTRRVLRAEIAAEIALHVEFDP